MSAAGTELHSMADSDFNAPLQSSYMMQHPPAPHAPGPETTVSSVMQPNYVTYNPMAYDFGGYRAFYSNQFSPQPPEPNRGVTDSYPYHHNRLLHHPFNPHSGHIGHNYYPPAADMFSHSLSPSTSGSFHTLQMPASPPLDPSEARNGVSMFSVDSSIPSGGQAYHLPAYPPFLPQQPHGFGSPPSRRPGPVAPSPPVQQPTRFADGTASSGQGRPQLRGTGGSGSSEPTHHSSSPLRRPSYERSHQASGTDRRPPPFPAAHSRRSDRSVSPRTSHRRSFDRYSTDLHPSSSPSEADEAAIRARMVQRRQRERRFMRQHFAMDGNNPTISQMQALKDKLRHFLPNELPEGSSPCCDICQKDYSTKHCLPTEEDEVAIQLPCKHVFGEHCINTWFETCKTHKNKITCPMCRKQLVEPMRVPPAALVAAMPEVLSLFSRSSQADQQTILRLARRRDQLESEL